MKNFKNRQSILILTVVIVVAGTVFILHGLGFLQKKKQPENIAEVIMGAYENIESMSGIIEYYEKEELTARVNFEFKSPAKFRINVMSQINSYTITYDGGDRTHTVLSEEPWKVRVDYVTEDVLKFILPWYSQIEMATLILEGDESFTQKRIPGEVVAGRETEGYEVSYNYFGTMYKERFGSTKKASCL